MHSERDPIAGVGWIVGSHSHRHPLLSLLECVAGTTGLEPATSAVTGQRSNQLSYVPRLHFSNFDRWPLEWATFASFVLSALFHASTGT